MLRDIAFILLCGLLLFTGYLAGQADGYARAIAQATVEVQLQYCPVPTFTIREIGSLDYRRITNI